MGTSKQTDQGETLLRVKLQNLSSSLKKLANVLLHSETEKSFSVTEPQIIHRSLAMANQIASLESLEKADGEIFASFLVNLTHIIQSIGALARGSAEQYRDEQSAKVLKILRDLEEEGRGFLPLVISIDEERKEAKHETMGGLLETLIDALQEKRHLIMRRTEHV